jgi:hypothetical protein
LSRIVQRRSKTTFKPLRKLNEITQTSSVEQSGAKEILYFCIKLIRIIFLIKRYLHFNECQFLADAIVGTSTKTKKVCWGRFGFPSTRLELIRVFINSWISMCCSQQQFEVCIGREQVSANHCWFKIRTNGSSNHCMHTLGFLDYIIQ